MRERPRSRKDRAPLEHAVPRFRQDWPPAPGSVQTETVIWTRGGANRGDLPYSDLDPLILGFALFG